MKTIPFLLFDSRVNAQAGEVALDEQLVELGSPGDRVDEDDKLVELQGV